jgi:hypothetical protein
MLSAAAVSGLISGAVTVAIAALASTITCV